MKRKVAPIRHPEIGEVMPGYGCPGGSERRRRISETLIQLHEYRMAWIVHVADQAVLGQPSMGWEEFLHLRKLEKQNSERVLLGLQPCDYLISRVRPIEWPRQQLFHLCPSYMAATVAAMERLEGTTM